MSKRAKRFIGQRLSEEGEMPFDELKGELEDEFSVKWNTAQNYIYEYAQYGERDDGRVVYDMAIGHEDALETGDDDDDSGSAPAVSLNEDDEIPPADGATAFGGAIDVRAPGHPRVPDIRSYIKRPMGGPKVSVDISEKKTGVELLAKAMASDDYGTLLIGEPGTGKGHMTRYVCTETNRPFARVNFGSRITKEKLVGGYVPRSNGEGLKDQLDRARDMAANESDLSVGEALNTLNVREKFKWQDGMLTKAVRKGWVFLADELNAAPPETLMPLHGLLEDGDNRTLELTEKGEVIEPHDEFTFVGTMNPPHHDGTKELNDALMGRLIPIEIPYLPADAEVGLLDAQTSLAKTDCKNLVDLAQDLRSSYPREISTPCTPRELLKIGEMAEIMNTEAAAKQVLLSMTHEEGERDAIRKRLDMASL